MSREMVARRYSGFVNTAVNAGETISGAPEHLSPCAQPLSPGRHMPHEELWKRLPEESSPHHLKRDTSADWGAMVCHQFAVHVERLMKSPGTPGTPGVTRALDG